MIINLGTLYEHAFLTLEDAATAIATMINDLSRTETSIEEFLHREPDVTQIKQMHMFDVCWLVIRFRAFGRSTLGFENLAVIWMGALFLGVDGFDPFLRDVSACLLLDDFECIREPSDPSLSLVNSDRQNLSGLDGASARLCPIRLAKAARLR